MGRVGPEKRGARRQGLGLPAWPGSSLRTAPQTFQLARTNDLASTVTYWLWRFDRPDDPVPLDNFWGKTVSQCVDDLRVAKNPQAGQPASPADAELMVDPYFPSTIAALRTKSRAGAASGRTQSALPRWSRDIPEGCAHPLERREPMATAANS